MGSKPLLRPPRLRPDSRVALIAPAGPLPEADDLARASASCRALGYVPVPGAHAAARHGYFAGRDEERLADLNWAITDPDIDALWCLRGGYGVTRLLDRVDYGALARRPKAVIGFSDITALLTAVVRFSGLVAFHGPVARGTMSAFNRTHFERVLAVPRSAGRLELAGEAVLPGEAGVVSLRGGVAEGCLVGGNFTLLQCLIGTRYFPDLDGAILVLEDVGEALYRIDRMLAHFRAIGALERLAGVAVGRLTDCAPAPDGAFGLDDVLRYYLSPLGIPVAYGFPVGHIDDQWTLPLGVRARLDADAGELDLLEPAVT